MKAHLTCQGFTRTVEVKEFPETLSAAFRHRLGGVGAYDPFVGPLLEGAEEAIMSIPYRRETVSPEAEEATYRCRGCPLCQARWLDGLLVKLARETAERAAYAAACRVLEEQRQRRRRRRDAPER